jgi:hypothetical protein
MALVGKTFFLFTYNGTYIDAVLLPLHCVYRKVLDSECTARKAMYVIGDVVISFPTGAVAESILSMIVHAACKDRELEKVLCAFLMLRSFG